MEFGESPGTVGVMGQTYPVQAASLVLYTTKNDDKVCRELFIEVDAGLCEEGIEGGGVFRIDRMVVAGIRSLAELDGMRMEFDADGPREGDTLGSEAVDFSDCSQWYFGYDDSDVWGFDRIKIDFKNVGGQVFQVRVECLLRNWEDSERLISGVADLTIEGVEADECD